MSYIAVGEITDENTSKKTKLKLACLAYAMNYNFTSSKKIQEYNRLISFASKHIQELENSEFTLDGSRSLKTSSIDAMRNSIKVAEQSINEIKNNVDQNKKRQDYLFKLLIEDGYFDFKNRAFTVAMTGRYQDFIVKNKEKEGSWIVDNKKLAELFRKDFLGCLPPGIPDKAFSFSLFKNRECRFEKSDALIIAFNHVLEDSVKEAMVKLTQMNLERCKDKLEADSAYPVTHTPKYEDAKHIAYSMPYLVETTGSNSSAGELTIDILRSPNPIERMKEIELQEQYPLMNIERYATIDKKLLGFLEDAFGGSIGKSEDGYRTAMKICMGHYAEEMSKEFNIEKELAKLDGKMIGKVEHGSSDCSL